MKEQISKFSGVDPEVIVEMNKKAAVWSNVNINMNDRTQCEVQRMMILQ